MLECMGYSFNEGYEYTLDEMKMICKKVLGKLISIKKEWIAVVVDKTDDVGCVIHSDIYFLKSYADTEALEVINSHEYIKNEDVSVYALNADGLALMLHKCFDGVCYSRFAHCEFGDYIDLGIPRSLYNKNTSFYIQK